MIDLILFITLGCIAYFIGHKYRAEHPLTQRYFLFISGIYFTTAVFTLRHEPINMNEKIRPVIAKEKVDSTYPVENLGNGKLIKDQ